MVWGVSAAERRTSAVAGPVGRLLWAGAMVVCAASGAARAQDAEAGAAQSVFHVSGFATLGATYNDNRDTGVITAYSQSHPAKSGLSDDLDSVLGLQAVWRPLNGTSITAQAVARPDDAMQIEVRMAYLRQELIDGFAVRLGRIRSPLYFDSDVAEVGYAYLTARPPIPLYSIVNSVTALDGGDVQWRHAWGEMAVLVQGYYGETRYQHHFYNEGFAAHAVLKGIKGGSISLLFPYVTLRASRTWADSYTMRADVISSLDGALTGFSGDVAALATVPGLSASQIATLSAQSKGVAALVNPFDNRPIYTSIGFDGTLKSLRLLGEWTELESQSKMVGKYQGYQFTVGYPVGDVTPYVTYAQQRRMGGSLNTSALDSTGLSPGLDAGLGAVQGALSLASEFANLSTRSVSVGARWDVRENVALKLQYDWLATPNEETPGMFAVKSLPIRNTTNLATLALNLVF